MTELVAIGAFSRTICQVKQLGGGCEHLRRELGRASSRALASWTQCILLLGLLLMLRVPLLRIGRSFVEGEALHFGGRR